MKIAICISGGIRYPEIGLRSIQNIFPNNDIKIFIHTWKVSNIEDYTKTIHGIQYKEIHKIVDNNLEIVNLYPYTNLLIEDYSEKKIKFEKIFNSLNFSEYVRNDIGPISMHYSIHKSNSLKKQYEIENNFIFDCVIRMRFDSDFEEKVLNVSNYKNGLYIPEGEDWSGGINDQFSLGSSSSMDIYSDFINHLSELQGCLYHPEFLLKIYLEKQSINMHRFDFPVRINNKIDFRKVLFGE
jgi:hypothetical protein